MAVSVLATLVASTGDEASYDLVGDESAPAVRVSFRWTGDDVEVDVDYDTEPRAFVRKGIRAVAGERSETGAWPARLVRIS